MKRKDLIKLFERNGWVFEREGGNHTVYTNGQISEAIPRHSEVNERLAKALIKKHNLK
jgi:mRNA interferase HicA